MLVCRLQGHRQIHNSGYELAQASPVTIRLQVPVFVKKKDPAEARVFFILLKEVSLLLVESLGASVLLLIAELVGDAKKLVVLGDAIGTTQ